MNQIFLYVKLVKKISFTRDQFLTHLGVATGTVSLRPTLGMPIQKNSTNGTDTITPMVLPETTREKLGPTASESSSRIRFRKILLTPDPKSPWGGDPPN